MTTTRAAEDLVPALRGVLHAWAFWFAAVAGGVLIALAPGGTARLAAAVYALGLCALFAGSATYHRWRWDVRWRPLLRRIDHSTIFVFIAASYTPIALLVLSGQLRVVVLATVWAGALSGVVFSVVWIGAPRWLVAGTYLAGHAARAAGGRRAALQRRRRRLRAQAPEPRAARVRLPRALPRVRHRRGRQPLRGHGGLGLLSIIVGSLSRPAELLTARALVVAPQGVGELPRHPGRVALLPQRDHDELAARRVVAADEDEVAVGEVADEDGRALPGLDAAGRPGLAHAPGDLGSRVEPARHALAEALDRVVGHRDEDARPAHRVAGAGFRSLR